MTVATHKTSFSPNPVQKNFIEAKQMGTSSADLFSSRMGEGKSTALAWAALYHTRHNPGARWALIRDTFENITGTTQKTFFEWFPPGVYGTYNASRKTFTWATGVATGEVIFMGMDDPQDASKLMSRELAGFGIDEPAPAVGTAGVSEDIFDMAMSRLRQPKMKWYAGKLAENNPDEVHWTYKRFVSPGQENYRIWQPALPENILHLPATYYNELRRLWAHRPDLVRRFVDGEFGFQQEGRPCTPQWADKLHLSLGLTPLRRQPLELIWDFGHNPTCVVTQRTPLGQWLILDSMVGDGIGVEELIVQWVKPLLTTRYMPLNCTWRHIGDPAGQQREQTSINRSAVRLLKKELGGLWRPGPVIWEERIEPLRAALTRTVGGRGMIQVDRERASQVWHALRGGYHFNVARTGLVSTIPKKNIHSHPGDAMGYGAAVLFPLGRSQKQANFGEGVAKAAGMGYFGRNRGSAQTATDLLKLGKPVPLGQTVPKHGQKMGA